MRRSPRPSPETRLGSSVAALLAGLVLTIVLTIVVTGCVASGTHDQVVHERDSLRVERRELEEEVRLLKVANFSLDNHVAGLVDEREDLLEKRESLKTSLDSTRAEEARLASNLKSREEELAMTAAALLAQSTRVDELQGTYEGLVSDLQSEVQRGEILISQMGEGLRVKVSQDILFDSGSARLSEEGRKVLGTVATRLKELDYAVAVEGHSDNDPIRGNLAKRYPTNWELAGARAASVVRLFAKQGVDGQRLTAVSHADTQPIADNATPEGRAMNRRIEIRLRPIGPDDLPVAPAAPDSSGASRKQS
jgi:chemotaxis protein MotB